MKILMLFALLCFSSGLFAQQNGINPYRKRLGVPTKDPNAPASDGKLGAEPAAAQDLPKGVVAPDVYGGFSKRVVEGKEVDLTEAIAWANESNFLDQSGPQTTNLGIVTSGASIGDYEERKAKLELNRPKFGRYLLKGQVVQASSVGALIRTPTGSFARLRGHPRQKDIAVGVTIATVAVPHGTYKYQTATGETATAAAYDFGVPQKP